MSSLPIPVEPHCDWQAPEKFALLYRTEAPKILRYLRATLRDQSEAEDALQEVFLKAFRALPRDRPASTRAWLFTLARNTAIDHARRRAHPEPYQSVIALADCAGDPSVTAPPLAGWLTEPELQSALDALPARQREVIVLRYLLGCSHAQSARVLDCSEPAVRRAHHLALRALARALSATGPRPLGRRREYAMGKLRLPRRLALGGFSLLRPPATRASTLSRP